MKMYIILQRKRANRSEQKRKFFHAQTKEEKNYEQNENTRQNSIDFSRIEFIKEWNKQKEENCKAKQKLCIIARNHDELWIEFSINPLVRCGQCNINIRNCIECNAKALHNNEKRHENTFFPSDWTCMRRTQEAPTEQWFAYSRHRFSRSHRVRIQHRIKFITRTIKQQKVKVKTLETRDVHAVMVHRWPPLTQNNRP